MTGTCLRRGAVAVASLAAVLSSATAVEAAGRPRSAAVDHFAEPWPLLDTFDAEPPRAHAAPGSSCVTAERYVTMVAAKRWGEIGGLFAADAVFLPPDGPALRGRQAITAWFARVPPVAIAKPLSFIASGPQCFMELAGKKIGQADDYWRLSAIDHFTMNAKGEIVRAVYYFRPQTLLGRPMDPVGTAGK